MSTIQKKANGKGKATAKEPQMKKVTVKDLSAADRAAGKVRGGYLRSPAAGAGAPRAQL